MTDSCKELLEIIIQTLRETSEDEEDFIIVGRQKLVDIGVSKDYAEDLHIKLR